jgi:hypothetical protein
MRRFLEQISLSGAEREVNWLKSPIGSYNMSVDCVIGSVRREWAWIDGGSQREVPPRYLVGYN